MDKELPDWLKKLSMAFVDEEETPSTGDNVHAQSAMMRDMTKALQQDDKKLELEQLRIWETEGKQLAMKEYKLEDYELQIRSIYSGSTMLLFDQNMVKAQKMAEYYSKNLVPSVLIIPREYVQPGESPNVVSDYIHADAYVRGLVFDMINPCRMFVNITQFWDQLEYFQIEIQKRMELILSNANAKKESAIDKNMTLLRPGLFVMVFAECGNTEWFRARIRFVDRGPPFKIHVQLVDYGTFLEITDLKNIKYMPRDIFYEFQHQSIECKLRFHKKICKDDEFPEWKPECDFKQVVLNRSVGIHFLERKYFENKDKSVWKNENVWIVTMNLLKKEHEASKDHTRNLKETDMYNRCLEESTVAEIKRRSEKRARRGQTRLVGQVLTAVEAQHLFEHNLAMIVKHGEFLCAIEPLDLSAAAAEHMLKKDKPLVGPF